MKTVRPVPDTNLFCANFVPKPVRNQFISAYMVRTKCFIYKDLEKACFCLESWYSTTELRPPVVYLQGLTKCYFVAMPNLLQYCTEKVFVPDPKTSLPLGFTIRRSQVQHRLRFGQISVSGFYLRQKCVSRQW